MRFLPSIVLTIAMITSVQAQETIEWVHAHGAASAATPGYVAVVEAANRLQNKYVFLNVFKPGGNGIVATNYVDEAPATRITSTTGAVADGFVTGRIDINKYSAVQGLWDVCWAAGSVLDLSRSRTQSVMAAASSAGSLAHYIALGLADRYGFALTMVYFKSNTEGFLNMAANNGVTLAADRARTIQDFASKNNQIKLLGLHCPVRHPAYPNIPTFAELGIDLPPASVTVIANTAMNTQRMQEIEQIFAAALKTVGNERLWEIGDLRSPVFANISPSQYHARHMSTLRAAQAKFAKELSKQQ